MKPEAVEHYTGAVCQIVATAAVCYFYWSHLPRTQQDQLRRSAQRLWSQLRQSPLDRLTYPQGRRWLESLWQRSA